jgi:hypothetical protein
MPFFIFKVNHMTREEGMDDEMDVKDDAKASSNASLSSDSEPSVPEFENNKGQTQLQTPGTCSSGYISEAFSSSNLTNEDSLSIKSNAGDFTPDKEVRYQDYICLSTVTQVRIRHSTLLCRTG